MKQNILEDKVQFVRNTNDNNNNIYYYCNYYYYYTLIYTLYNL